MVGKTWWIRYNFFAKNDEQIKKPENTNHMII